MIEEYLHNCLFFTSGRLARVITRMAEEEFRITGLSPTYAFLIMVVNERQGISQKELCEVLHLAQSTVTRFIDKLEHGGYVIRKNEGKNSLIYTTAKGKRAQNAIEKAWESLYKSYSEILGQKEGDSLNRLIDKAGDKLEKN